MVFEARDTRGQDGDLSGSERPQRAVGGGELGRHVPALPGDEDAARRDEREADLRQLRQRGDGPRRDARPAPAMRGVAGEGLRPRARRP